MLESGPLKEGVSVVYASAVRVSTLFHSWKALNREGGRIWKCLVTVNSGSTLLEYMCSSCVEYKNKIKPCLCWDFLNTRLSFLQLG